MTPNEVREKTIEELKVLEKDLKEELFKLKMQAGTGQLEKSHRLKEVKKDIARILTILKEKLRKAATV
ncbi:MAG: 50S ribosomal protein L29 [bacterium]|nr:50S ribosomal protein L29 [bacterium]